MTQNFNHRTSPSKKGSGINRLLIWLLKNSFKFGLILMLVLFLLKDNLSFQLNFNTLNNEVEMAEDPEAFSIIRPISNLFENNKKERKEEHSSPSGELNLSNDYSNMTYPKNGKNNPDKSNAKTAKLKKQQNYISRFAEVARSEMRKYGIPASITLAQGLIESNAGESTLSRKNNNHFGIKCFSKSCKKGHCSNFTDDSHKDFFRKYETAWESYRAHSIMLGGDRYKHLKKLKISDYRAWAHGLKKAGYATDKRYAEKLIHIIEAFELYQYDL